MLKVSAARAVIGPLFALLVLSIQPVYAQLSAPPQSPGNEACASCHADIYRSYMKTTMANASGVATEGLLPGEFFHKPSGIRSKVYQEGGKAWLSFERPGDSVVKGKRELLYYIGSGHRGRTYLFSDDGFVFEAPVNWYAQKKMWDMAPAYQNARTIPLNLPAVPECLTCHTSGMRPPIAGSENRYAMPVFEHGGITCERCHGDNLSHAKGVGESINPLKLPPEKRDSLCMECHLEGKVAITRPGKHLYDFRLGDDLLDDMRYFVLQNPEQQGIPALSQVEALAQSRCAKSSGAAMSCMSCHDPHYTPPESEKVAYYHGKCIACHGEAFAAKHQHANPNCIGCHMPLTASSNIAHTQATDHRILRRRDVVSPLQSAALSAPHLEVFPSRSPSDVRDVALAWESLAEGGMESAVPIAEHDLKAAKAANADDPSVLSALGYVEQRQDKIAEATKLYQQALKFDSNRIDAAANLGVIEAQAGHLGEAVRLWQSAFERAPGRSSIGMNIVEAYCAAEKYEEARQYLVRVLEFNPDLPAAKQMLVPLSATKPSCGR